MFPLAALKLYRTIACLRLLKLPIDLRHPHDTMFHPTLQQFIKNPMLPARTDLFYAVLMTQKNLL